MLGVLLCALVAFVSLDCKRAERQPQASVGSSPVPVASGASAAPFLPTSAEPAEHGDSAIVGAGSRRGRPRTLVWDFQDGPYGELRVLVSVPRRGRDEPPLPVLVALHGRGEALKGPWRGARGWLEDYQLHEAIDALEHPPLDVRDFHGFVSAERLSALNSRLSTDPYRGMVVVMPYTPIQLSGAESLEAVVPYGRFIVESVLPRVYAETPSFGSAATTAIDGVSLGGRLSVLIGLMFPQAFGSVGSLQAAFGGDEVQKLTTLAAGALRRNPALRLRVLTSSGDYYREPLTRLSEAWRRAGISHDFASVAGPHDYDFNRGPGAIEMLVFHDEALRTGDGFAGLSKRQ